MKVKCNAIGKEPQDIDWWDSENKNCHVHWAIDIGGKCWFCPSYKELEVEDYTKECSQCVPIEKIMPECDDCPIKFKCWTADYHIREEGETIAERMEKVGMSYNKYTLRDAVIDHLILDLKDMGIPYKITVMAELKGRGVNDISGKCHAIRRLEFRGANGKKIIYLERMERADDCDVNDIVTTHRFNEDEEPEKWVKEITI